MRNLSYIRDDLETFCQRIAYLRQGNPCPDELETRLSDTRDLDETVSGLERWANDLDSQGGGFREAATYLQVVIAEIITREFESGNEAARTVED
jgi:hypothetical protein|tara:strand:- start:21 stop:302 length:282 start_codon:yes stop_codon:yes gene_type:complete